MEKRKKPEKDLRNKSGLFFQIGLFTALLLVVSAFEYKQKEVVNPLDLTNMTFVEEAIPPITEIKPPPPPPPKPVVHNPVEADPEEPEIEMPEIIIDTETIPDPPEEFIEPEEEPVSELPFDIVESMPEPEGGFEGFYKFVNKKLKYPAQARRMDIEGTVFMSFVVDENGDMTDIKILKGIGAGCDEEVLHIFEKPPKWTPGKQRGVPVKVNKIMPIKFILN
ncbi:MAG: energy transducer TonB [Bacteroidota bacterium]